MHKNHHGAPSSAAPTLYLGDVPQGAELNSVLCCLANGSFERIKDREVSHAVEVLKKIVKSGEEYAVDSSSNFLAAGEVFQQNREMCLSLIRRSSDGDLDARSDYEARRVCALDLLPSYLRHETIKVCRDALATIKPQVVIPKDEAIHCAGFKLWLQSKLEHPELLPALAGLALVATYSVGREISEYFGVMRRSQQLIVDFSPQGIRLPRDMFNPACEGPVGKVAASAFGRSVELMLASSILEDLLFDIAGDDSPLSRHIDPVFDTIKAQSLRTLKAPWDVHTVPLVKNMQLLADLWISGELLTKTVERVMASPKYLLEHDFRMTVEDMNYALMTKEAKRQSAIAGQASQNPSDERPNPNQTHTTATLTEKQKFFRALQGASPKALDARAFADEHRALYSSYKRGHASLTECLDLVRNGATQLPASSEQWSDTLAVPSTPPPSGPTMGKQKALESPPARHEAEEAERYEIVGYDSKWFQGWLNSLPQHERRLIAKRLDSARDGHFGDYVQLRGNRWLFEFRFHLGDGKRVFFSFDGDTKIVLHAAGSKKEQSRLIETAIKHRGS